MEVEAWGTLTVELDREVLVDIARSRLVAVRVDPSGAVQLVAGSEIGTAVGDGWVVRVVPKLSIPKLMFLLSYALDPEGWRRDIVEAGSDLELFSAVASAFALHAQRAIEPDPLRGYVHVEERATTLRGRLRVAEQMHRSRGLALPLEIEYDDFILDIQENRMILAAAELLLRFREIPNRARMQLLRLRHTLAGVTPHVPSPAVPPITRLNRRYAPALQLAQLILTGASIEWRGQKVAASTFRFDMNRVFEDFLSAALTDALRPYGGHVALQNKSHHLDVDQDIRLKPDITWWSGSAVRAVIDAKYKALRDDPRFPNADAYQLLAYCKALDLRTGFLVYAHDANEKPRDHRVVHGGPCLRVRTVNVTKQPAEVLAEVDELAEEISTTYRGSGNPTLLPL